LNDRGVPAVSLGMKHNTLPRTRRSFVVMIGVVLALVLVLGACSSSSKSGSSSTSTTGVTIKDLAFTTTPVKAGATVTVQNNDNVMHTVTSDDNTSFDVSIDPGKSATFTAPSKAGSYKFHCKIHSSMHGTLTVQ